MHDQSLERKLRAALQAEGDGLAFTITAAELERRLNLRRRAGLGPIGSLGLAAAVGLGLLGLAGVAGGWFEQRTVVVPPSVTNPSASPAPDPGPSGSAEPGGQVLLPTLDELVAGLDPATIVRAEAFGRSDGPVAATPDGLHHIEFGAVAAAGSYAVTIACLGSDDLQLTIARADRDVPGTSVLFSCDGQRSSRLVELDAGGALGIKTSQPASWRIVVESPVAQTLRPTEIATDPVFPFGEVVLLDRRGASPAADYGDPLTGGGISMPKELGSVPQRDEYHVFLACAGPEPVRYGFAPTIEPLPVELASTQVQCDGAFHEDVLGLPAADPSRILVTADARNAWRIVVTTQPPPVALEPDGGGWRATSGAGPDLYTDGFAQSITLPGNEGGGRIRVVVSCQAEADMPVSVDVGAKAGVDVREFTAVCGRDGPVVTAREFDTKATYVSVILEPAVHTWLAMTLQEPASR